MRILITGGAGFLGRHLAAALAAVGHRVVAMDDLSSRNATFGCPELRHPGIQHCQASVFDERRLAELVRSADVVVHFACIVGVEHTIANPITTARNIEGTLSLCELLRPEQTLVFGSSADVYGMHSHLHDHAMGEDDRVVFEHAMVNRWVYPKVKALEESVVGHCAARSVSVRIFNSYGPGMDFPHAKRVLPQMIERVFRRLPFRVSGDGSQRRTFCYHTDTIDGVLLALAAARDSPAGSHATFNIGHPQAYTIRELAERINRVAVELGLLGAPLPIELHAQLYSQPFDDAWHRAPDIRRARELLGFEPRVGLEDGLARTLMAYAPDHFQPVMLGAASA